MNTIYKESFLKAAGYLSALLVIIILYFSHIIVISGLIGLAVACLISPVLEKAQEKLKLPKVLSLILVFTILLIIVSALTLLFYSNFKDQILSLIDQIPAGIHYLERTIKGLSLDIPFLKNIFDSISYEKLVEHTMSFVKKFFLSTSEAFTGLILGTIIAFFTSVRSDVYFKGWVSFFPKKLQKNIKKQTLISATALRKWFATQILDMLIIGFITSLSLLIAGVQNWAVYGLATGILSIVPYFGIASVLLFSSVITLAAQPEKFYALITVFTLTQFIEGNFILPYLMRKRVHLPAALLIFFMVLMGSWLGVIGIFISTPLLAVLLSMYRQGKVTTS